MARVYVTRRLPGDGLDRLAAEHEVDVWDGEDAPPRERLLELVPGYDALLTMLVDPVDAVLLDTAGADLKAVVNYAVGTDNIDLDAATARGVAVGNTPDVLTGATADLALALMLASMRRLPEAEATVREGRWTTWKPDALLGRDLSKATVAVVGTGRIGRAVADRVRGFGAKVIGVGRHDSLEDALAAADVVTLHTPLTDGTRGLIGEAQLRAMKPTATLVNTARGAVVDTAALERALREGWIRGAALDVTDPEPLPADHPLLGAPNLVISPHIASGTVETRTEMVHVAVDNVRAALAGEPMPHCANPAVYET